MKEKGLMRACIYRVREWSRKASLAALHGFFFLSLRHGCMRA
jgi:hypothetical protein